jgi:hypothetical protein
MMDVQTSDNINKQTDKVIADSYSDDVDVYRISSSVVVPDVITVSNETFESLLDTVDREPTIELIRLMHSNSNT